MRYITDRKRADGKGASGTGTEHHWSMQISSVGLAFLLPVWLYIFGSALGGTRDEVVETFSHPFPAIVTALLLVVGMRHFIGGATMMLGDYTSGSTRKMAVIGMTAIAWMVAATGLFALARMAL
ncbi:MAG: succinate dehydrogenase, hydrophobic membrane anchor protein [Rhodobacteraceae bacterium]|nr:succinate dehydrogenase, hydrophobic membrane anchor protein [Paracoccaceae bacterium]